jgi:hypothetical protein
LGQRKAIQQDVEVQGHNMCNPSWHVPVTALHVLEIRPTYLNIRILEIKCHRKNRRQSNGSMKNKAPICLLLVKIGSILGEAVTTKEPN